MFSRLSDQTHPAGLSVLLSVASVPAGLAIPIQAPTMPYNRIASYTPPSVPPTRDRALAVKRSGDLVRMADDLTIPPAEPNIIDRGKQDFPSVRTIADRKDKGIRPECPKLVDQILYRVRYGFLFGQGQSSINEKLFCLVSPVKDDGESPALCLAIVHRIACIAAGLVLNRLACRTISLSIV